MVIGARGPDRPAGEGASLPGDVSDPDARRAGIEGGLGVLGAIQVERTEFTGG